ncbi:MAG: hypothetical protein RL260_4049 [Pseudomonadota bacterium]
MPQTRAASFGVHARTVSRSASKPLVCAAIQAGSVSPSHSMTCSMPWYSATSVPGWICRNRSAVSAVSVRRTSTTIQRWSGLALRASSSRRNRIGCAQAVLLPVMNTVSAWAMSS